MDDTVKLVSRISLALIFLSALIGKLTGFEGTISYMKANGMTFFTELWLIDAILLLGFGSFSLLSGILLKWGIGALLLFLVTATLIFHFDLSDKSQIIQVFKNLAIAGGLLMVTVTAPGKYTFNNYFKNKKNENNTFI